MVSKIVSKSPQVRKRQDYPRDDGRVKTGYV